MVKTKSEKVLGKMILSRIEKIKGLIKEVKSLNQSNKRYSSTIARIAEDIWEIKGELETIEPEYNSKLPNDEYDDFGYLAMVIENAGYDETDEDFLSELEDLKFKMYITFIKKRLKTSKK